MPSRQKRDVEQAARQRVREQMAADYAALAQVESHRAELLAAALVAVERRREAEAAIAEADRALSGSARELVASGLSAGEVGELLGIEARQLRQLLRASTAGKSKAPVSGDGSGDGDR